MANETTANERNEIRMLAANLENHRFRELIYKLIGREQETLEAPQQQRHNRE